jgi:hypothetical protein
MQTLPLAVRPAPTGAADNSQGREPLVIRQIIRIEAPKGRQ